MEPKGKPTINGIIKGRPGKGRVLSLGQRRYCYAQPKHQMTEDNTFRYTPKPTKANAKPLERQWCRRCRMASRKRSNAKRLAAAKAAAQEKRREVKAELNAAMPEAKKGKASAATLRKANKGIELSAEGARRSADNRIGATPRNAKGKPKSAAPSGNVACGSCDETFRDPVAASKHFAKAHGKKAAA